MKRLLLDFVNTLDGKRRRIVIPEPKEGLTAEYVSQVMDRLIEQKALPEGYVKDRAAIVETTTDEFFNLL
ncbi:DUF2922 domain-containing protein [Pseudothermotoga thermarum]|uniref:DUF2922 domain-containing protein n=1 Tax=Pseudothermotoga thermarum DSM 5069 TaxID=688269 RepID=F7YUZ0_9THEM|nr:DUF2922 domain-containing protein [Pseudothermotoga thermarum]AEH51558.1 hypothetical protein Theth_1505 [Pseudothermotoga thermarum DSM 5069]